MPGKEDTIHDFSLIDGPLYRLGLRLGLVVKKTNTIRIGLVLSVVTWSVLVILAGLEGLTAKLFSLQFIAVHIRLIVVIPLFFLTETLVTPQMDQFVGNIASSGLVSDEERPLFASLVRRIRRLGDIWMIELLFLLAVFTITMFISNGLLIGSTSNVLFIGRSVSFLEMINSRTNGDIPWTVYWYFVFCLPLFRFLLVRCIWQIMLWCYFLWRLQKLNLRLNAVHPDETAGLGYLEVVHEHFIPLVIALSAILSASLAEDIVSQRIPFNAIYSVIPFALIPSALLFILPLFMFTPKLSSCRNNALSEYMKWSSRHVTAFHFKWGEQNESDESLLGTADLHSFAALNNSINNIRGMRCIPASKRLLMGMVVSTILPLLPLLFLKYNFYELVLQITTMLFGLRKFGFK
ncbi:MAG: hypothetical protein WCG19_01985 [Chlorobiaceae bacterium]